MKKVFALILALCMLASLCACGETDGTAQPESASDDNWVIYWYLCGSNLESESGFATSDLQELLQVELPENIEVVIETGGSSYWQNDFVSAETLQRYVYDSEGLQFVDEQPSASMGDAQTLTEFLDFAATNYPAERTAFIFWNHGGGSVAGAAADELYDNDSLTLDEMYAAFSAVYPCDAGNPPLELVGFDTCLMATVDVAATFSDIAGYLVASEELEPANGWYYSEWVQALADNPEMGGAQLGQIICDAYMHGCEEVGTQDNATLSVTDLSLLPELLSAYEAFGAEALTAACENPSFFTQFARSAEASENYGGNTREQGYTNMVDLGHLARQSAQLVSSSEDVLNALDDCVLYRVNGQYRTEATGLSCYYSYSADTDELTQYEQLGTGSAFKYFFEYGLTGTLSDAGMEYVGANMQLDELPVVQTLSAMDWDGALLDVNDNGVAVLTLGPQAEDVLSEIGFSLYYEYEENNQLMLLGTDNDMEADWENGIFYDNFRGVWGSIDGCMVYMELSCADEDYNLYSVPVLLNGEEYNLQVVYDFTTEQWSILGARRGIDDDGMADKQLRLLTEGDEITTIWYLAFYDGEDDFEPYTADTITVTMDTAFSEMQLADGDYTMVFEMRDAAGNCAYSDSVLFSCENGDIYTTVFE